MFGRDLAEPYPSVSTDDRAADTARLPADQLPALVVLDMDQRPYAMVTGSQFLKQPVVDCVPEAPHVAAVIDDRHLAEGTERIAALTVTDWLLLRAYTPPVVGPGARALQVAALMARERSSLVAVERDGGQGRLVGVITAARLMERLIGEL
nr:hypothetical protein OG781_17520 [Streptomyces sp. NBC_00830]